MVTITVSPNIGEKCIYFPFSHLVQFCTFECTAWNNTFKTAALLSFHSSRWLSPYIFLYHQQHFSHTPTCSQAQLGPEYWCLEHVLLHLLNCFSQRLYSGAKKNICTALLALVSIIQGEFPEKQFLYWPWGRLGDVDQLNNMGQLQNEK